MKAMFAGFIAAAAIGVAAYYGLHMLGFSAAEATSGNNVRLN